jgi:hypothetical protein
MRHTFGCMRYVVCPTSLGMTVSSLLMIGLRACADIDMPQQRAHEESRRPPATADNDRETASFSKYVKCKVGQRCCAPMKHGSTLSLISHASFMPHLLVHVLGPGARTTTSHHTAAISRAARSAGRAGPRSALGCAARAACAALTTISPGICEQ